MKKEKWINKKWKIRFNAHVESTISIKLSRGYIEIVRKIKINKLILLFNSYLVNVAERTGFEPAIRLLPYTLSKRAPSTTRPSLHSNVDLHQLVPSIVHRSQRGEIEKVSFVAFLTFYQGSCTKYGFSLLSIGRVYFYNRN